MYVMFFENVLLSILMIFEVWITARGQVTCRLIKHTLGHTKNILDYFAQPSDKETELGIYAYF